MGLKLPYKFDSNSIEFISVSYKRVLNMIVDDPLFLCFFFSRQGVGVLSGYKRPKGV
jgi:hypothetical protein